MQSFEYLIDHEAGAYRVTISAETEQVAEASIRDEYRDDEHFAGLWLTSVDGLAV